MSPLGKRRCLDCGAKKRHLEGCSSKYRFCKCGIIITKRAKRCWDCHLKKRRKNQAKYLRLGMKRCPSCQEIKSLEDFYLRKDRGVPYSDCKDCTKTRAFDFKIQGKFGLAGKEYQLILDIQGRVCAICGASVSDNGKRLAIDHDHKTGRIRGLLCNGCNVGLGMFRDNPKILRKAIRYLKENGG